MSHRWALWCALLLSVSFARAATFYVAPGGLDANPGTEAAPWQTVQKAADSLQPGDTVLVRAGVYGKVTVNVSGSAEGGFVAFRNYPDEVPVIDGTGEVPPEEDNGLFLLVQKKYVVIEGFELRNYRSTTVKTDPAGIFLRGACEHVQIRGCKIHAIENTAGNVKRSGNAFGIAVYGSGMKPATQIQIDGNELFALKTGSSECLVINGNVTDFEVTNNRVHDCNNIGIDFAGYENTAPKPALDRARRGVCRGNEVWNISSQHNQAYKDGDFAADGIYCDGSADILIEQNIVHDNDIGIELSSEHPGRLTSGIVVQENRVYRNRQTGLFLGGYAPQGTGGTSGCIIRRNTFWHNDTLQWENGEAQIRSRTTGCVLTGNTFVAGAAGLAITVPVAAAQNVRNRLDYNQYYSTKGEAGTMWTWNKKPCAGFAAWQKASRQDAHGSFADPGLVFE